MESSQNIIIECHYERHNSTIYFIAINTHLKTTSTFSLYYSTLASTYLDIDNTISKHISHNAIKALIFISNEKDFKHFNAWYNLRTTLLQFCKKNDIYCLFCNSDAIFIEQALKETKTIVKENECVLYITRNQKNIEGIVLVRKTNGYKFFKLLNDDNKNCDFTKRWKIFFMQSIKPKKIIIAYNSEMQHIYLNAMETIFSEYNPIPYKIENDLKLETVVQKFMHQTNQITNPYNVEMNLNSYTCKLNEDIDIFVSLKEPLPFSHILQIESDKHQKISILTNTPEQNTIIEEINLSIFNNKIFHFKFTVNEYCQYCYEITPLNKDNMNVINDISKSMESTLNIKFNESLKITNDISTNTLNLSPTTSQSNVNTLKQNSIQTEWCAKITFTKETYQISVLNNGNEVVQKNEDDEFETPLYISFYTKPPIVGKRALELLTKKPEFVVYDIITLCSLTTDELTNPKWSFSIVKENESLCVSLNNEQAIEAIKVENLLSIVLQNAIKTLTKDNSYIYNVYIFEFKDFKASEMLKKNLKKAANALQLNYILKQNNRKK